MSARKKSKNQAMGNTPSPVKLDYKFTDQVKTKGSVEEVADFKFHNVETANILIVGSTGTGKTTFLNVLRNPRYVSQYEIDSQTTEAQMAKNLFEVDGNFHMIQVIDTPGFGDSSAASKTDFELEEMILKFIKQGVTELHMVLVTVRYGIRLEKGQVDTIMNVLKFLGKDMRKNTSILCTFAEGTSLEERKEWVMKTKNSNVSHLLKYCRGKVFFTGMQQKGTEMEKQVFVNRLRVDQTKIIKKALSSEPVLISGEEHDRVSSQFKVYESAAKDSLTLKKLLPEIPSLAHNVDSLRKDLGNFPDDETANTLFEKYSEIQSETINQQCVEWSKLQTAVEDYIEKGGNVQRNAQEVRKQYNILTKAVDELNRCKFNLSVFGNDSDSDYEIEI